ncbi:MAG: Fe-S-containing protein [Nitrospirota bacterium]
MMRKGTASSRPILCLLLVLLCITACGKQPTYTEAPLSGQEVAIDVSLLSDGVPHFFRYHYQGRNINFFVVKMEGKVLSFFDACMKCYPKRLGFRFDNGSVVCKACSEQYPLTEIEKGFGSCYPIRLEGRLQDHVYRIPVSAIQTMADKF